MSARRYRAVALALVVPLGAGVAAFLLTSPSSGRSGPTVRGSQPPPGILAPGFTLTDALTGRTVRMRDVRGRAVALTFLDTACTDLCPLIAPIIANGVKRLDLDERTQVVALAITVNPAVDTPARVRAFLRRHDAAGTLHYLLGTIAQLTSVWNAYYVTAAVFTGDDDVHSAPVRVYDRRGEWISSLHQGTDLTPANLAHDLRAALQS